MMFNQKELQQMELHKPIIFTEQDGFLQSEWDGKPGDVVGISAELLANMVAPSTIGRGQLLFGGAILFIVVGFDRKRDCFICQYIEGVGKPIPTGEDE